MYFSAMRPHVTPLKQRSAFGPTDLHPWKSNHQPGRTVIYWDLPGIFWAAGLSEDSNGTNAAQNGAGMVYLPTMMADFLWYMLGK